MNSEFTKEEVLEMASSGQLKAVIDLIQQDCPSNKGLKELHKCQDVSCLVCWEDAVAHEES